MQTKTIFKFLSAISISGMLVACGGGGGTSPVDTIQQNSNNSNSAANSSAFTGNSSASNSSTSSIDTTSFSNIGFGTEGAFAAGVIGLGIDTASLSAGGSTTLTVNLVSSTGTLVTENLSVTFNSKCFAAQKAKLSATTVSTSSGEASTTYTANGCVGDDLVTATVTHNNKSFTAQVTINVQVDTIQTVTFVDATPSQINLKGTGGAETSNVRFRVLGKTGAPIEDVPVTFSLSTSVGGLSLTTIDNTNTVKTDSSGYASATVQAGTITTSARVTAQVTVVGTTTKISTQSNQLLVSTGIPDQKSMSLSTSTFNPAAWQFDNVTATITILLADAFNNPAPDGTAVSFTTEGGSIESGCTTTDGGCSVKWKSQSPRPVRNDSDFSTTGLLCTDASSYPTTITSLSGNALHTCEAKRAGRITVLATAIGNESFSDKDGDGFFTPGVDIFKTKEDGGDCVANVPVSSQSVPAGSSIIPCDDLPEAYLDKDESRTRDSTEPFVNFFKYDPLTPDTTSCSSDPLFYDSKYYKNDCTTSNSDSSEYTSANGLYNGVLCSEDDAANKLCSRNSVSIRKELVLSMSCDTPLIELTGLLPYENASEAVPAGGTASDDMILADCNGNALPVGTTVTIDISSASDISVASNLGSGTLGNRVDWYTLNLSFKGTNDTKAPKGTVYLNIKVPTTSGDVSTSIPVKIN